MKLASLTSVKELVYDCYRTSYGVFLKPFTYLLPKGFFFGYLRELRFLKGLGREVYYIVFIKM